MTNQHLTLPDLGWSNFYQQQLDIDEFGTLNPVRVSDVHRNRVEAFGVAGAVGLPMVALLAETGVTVGDWILLDQSGAVVRILERKSALKRRAAGDNPSAQLIAANVDSLFIVSSCNADFNIARMERYLALARQAQIEPVVVLTKADMCADPGEFRTRAEQALPGLFVETLDGTDPKAAEHLAPWCGRGQSIALLGSSGVGKTTLTNTLTGADAQTRGIREDDAKGRHTTTGRSTYRTLSGAWIIDTPGMRSLRLTDVADGVDQVFADLTDLARHCRFNDCAHDTEPGCAIQAAIKAGEMDPARLKRWQKLQREDARHTETIAESRQRYRDLQKKYGVGKARLKEKRGDFY